MKIYINKKEIHKCTPNNFADRVLSTIIVDYPIMSYSAIRSSLDSFFDLMDEYIEGYQNEHPELQKHSVLRNNKQKYNKWREAFKKIDNKQDLLAWVYERILCVEGLSLIK